MGPISFCYFLYRYCPTASHYLHAHEKTAGLFYQGECKIEDNITDLLDDEGTLALTIRSESFLPGQQLQGVAK
ncbi:MAG: hypothetical protein M3P08_03240 [Thermoproteota archaeon]|nr:hypothetical protein [Thermoproteota archaeon]